MKTFAIVGTFDENGGRPSKIGANLTKDLGWSHINGGNIKILELFNSGPWDALLWMPNIPNNIPKLLPRLKVQNRKLILISSKRCGTDYTDNDVVGRLLKSKSNLGIAIRKTVPSGNFTFKLMDPLGNLYTDTSHLSNLAFHIKDRVDKLGCITRYGSKCVGPLHPFVVNPEFLAVVQRYGREFSKYVNAINPNRYLGNASTRCAYGFPAERLKDTILVSRRNIPKDSIVADDFVEIMLGENSISFWGYQKPSVDAPVQAMLFKHYPEIKYMIHGHTYIKDAPTTTNKLPCGAIEEFGEINELVRATRSSHYPTEASIPYFSINLRGHGCIIACRDLSYFNTIKLEPRPFLEK